MEIEKPSLTARSTTKTNTCISKTAFHKTKVGKCQRPSGTLYRNPYLNFLREFRQRNNGLSAVEMIRRGAKEWMTMSKEDKLQYIEEAFYAPKKRKAPPPPPPPAPVQKAKLRMVPYPKDCGIVCPRMKAACGGKKKRRKKSRKAKCGKKRRRPKKKSCGKKRRPKRRPKKKRCPI